jgi:hypothetical protein
MFNIEATRHGSTKAGAIARAAAVAVVAVAVALHAKPEGALAQDRSTPIDLFVQTLFGADTMDACLTRVRAGFARAGYANIADDPNTNGVKGVVAGGDTAGIVSMVSCIPIASGASFNIALASAGAGSLGDFAPQTQNNRLLGAIINS